MKEKRRVCMAWWRVFFYPKVLTQKQQIFFPRAKAKGNKAKKAKEKANISASGGGKRMPSAARRQEIRVKLIRKAKRRGLPGNCNPRFGAIWIFAGSCRSAGVGRW
jgi:hypothetical protein